MYNTVLILCMQTDDGQAPAVIFCKYPFVLDARAKERLMMIESKLQMNVSALI